MQVSLDSHTRKTPKLPHHPEELKHLLYLASFATSILEIGSRYGYCLKFMAERMPIKGRVVAVDLPGVLPWGDERSLPELISNVESLRGSGYDIHMVLSDSTEPETVALVETYGPFDLVFIDGDHSYEGAKKDWENYGPMGDVVVFHDIVEMTGGGKNPEVFRLWREIEGNKREFIAPNSQMGLGIWTR